MEIYTIQYFIYKGCIEIVLKKKHTPTNIRIGMKLKFL